MSSQIRSLVLLLLSILFVAACGQKGPLFLPGNTNEVSMTIPGQQTEPDDEDDDDEAENKNQ